MLCICKPKIVLINLANYSDIHQICILPFRCCARDSPDWRRARFLPSHEILLALIDVDDDGDSGEIVSETLEVDLEDDAIPVPQTGDLVR